MARSRAVSPPTPSKDGMPLRTSSSATMKNDEFGEDPWALAFVNGGDYVHEEPPALSSRVAELTIKHDTPDDYVDQFAAPTLIAQGLWKVTSPNGLEELTYKPIPGFEHMWTPSAQSLSQRGLRAHSRGTVGPTQATTMARTPATYRPRRRKTIKRSRSVARGSHSPHSAVQDSTDDENEYEHEHEYARAAEDGGRHAWDMVRVATDQSHTFYIGDVDELSKFFRRRLDELTMKPVRPIITAWIKQLEPKRLSQYGPYHKQLPGDLPPHRTPPWWPHNVPYEEPSHLDKAGLLALAVDMMLLHRRIDEVKRRGAWIAKLRQAATYAVETTAADQFSSSKGNGFSAKMRTRALEDILPNLFETAQTYEDHFAKYNLYEGCGAEDPGFGTHVTWHPLSRPSRQPIVPKPMTRKRLRTARVQAPRVEESGDETEVDDTLATSYLRRSQAQRQTRAAQASNMPVPQQQPPYSSASRQEHSHRMASPQQVPHLPLPPQQLSALPASQEQPSHVPAPQTPTIINHRVPAVDAASSASQHEMRPHVSTTPETSFGHPMHGLSLAEDMDLDVKAVNHNPYSAHTLNQHSFAFNQPMQYPGSHPGYSMQGFHPQDNRGSFSSSVEQSFPSPSQCSTASFAASMAPSNLTYDYQGIHPSTPMHTVFHGLPVDHTVDYAPQHYHH
ncbi:hypothetical protein EJ02DRAFT_171497 [Clathrospora elynae]|uniref:Subtelomeric hrmA-associated cluster protein AFUB-079030/YDR124W-like helical bundle domain-containing protein n=1 Tax=Clathrospora elynae TaxID=706981 RepID=A0A6A5T575_9PLEO|nr:hypothetical protein EJ02DRAFT_171497 [Clathrospora elynae]